MKSQYEIARDEGAEKYVAGGYGCDGDTSADSFAKGANWAREFESKNVEKLVQVLKRASKLIDDVKYECAASVYTLTDDEFTTVLYVRDLIDSTLKEYEDAK